MRLTFTATRDIVGCEDAIKRHVLLVTREHGATEFTTGACVGGDALIARTMLAEFPDAIHRLVVPANRSQVDIDLYHDFITHTGGWACIEFMPAGSTYRDRNLRLLDHGDMLCPVANYDEDDGHSRRSGTWMTVRLARARRGGHIQQALRICDPLILQDLP